MTPLRLRVHNVATLRDVDLNLGGLPEGIVAIVAPNGAGKSTLLDAIGFAAFYRAWSSKPGELRDYAPGPARLDLDVEMGGSVYALRLRIDPNARGGAGQTDATIARDGVPLTDGTRASDYDLAVCDWPATRDKPATRGVFPSRRLLLASAFASQDRSGGFAALGPAERKALFGELLGTEEHQERSVRARERGAALDVQIADLVRDLARIEDDQCRAASLRLDIEGAEREHLAAAQSETRAERALEAAAAETAAARAALDLSARAAEAAILRRAELVRALTAAEGEASKALAALGDLERVLERAADIRARASELAEASTSLARAKDAYASALAAKNSATAAELAATRERDRAAESVGALEAARLRLEADLAALAESEARAAEEERLLDEIDRLTLDLNAAQNAARVGSERLADARRKAADTRAELARAETRAGLLDGVPCGGGIVHR